MENMTLSRSNNSMPIVWPIKADVKKEDNEIMSEAEMMYEWEEEQGFRVTGDGGAR